MSPSALSIRVAESGTTQAFADGYLIALDNLDEVIALIFVVDTRDRSDWIDRTI